MSKNFEFLMVEADTAVLFETANLAEKNYTHKDYEGTLTKVRKVAEKAVSLILDKEAIILPSRTNFNNSLLSLNISIPIFDGFTKRYQMEQKKIALDKVKNGQTLLKQSIDFETRQADITIKNAFASLETQKRNQDLAQEIVRVSKIKYKEGVGSNIEVINAESSYKEAQTNYFAALYDLLIAKVDLTKARGELYTETK